MTILLLLEFDNLYIVYPYIVIYDEVKVKWLMNWKR